MSSVRAKAVAVLTGIVLFFAMPSIISHFVGDYSSWYLTLLVLPYGVSGIVLGTIWPNIGWRLGVWLFLVWPPMLFFMVFLSADKPVNLKGDPLDFLGYMLILPAGCIGAWLGSLMAWRIGGTRAESSGNLPQH